MARTLLPCYRSLGARAAIHRASPGQVRALSFKPVTVAMLVQILTTLFLVVLAVRSRSKPETLEAFNLILFIGRGGSITLQAGAGGGCCQGEPEPAGSITL